MKLKQARELGEACGLTTDAECIVNAELHSLSLFSYLEIGAEMKELRDDTIAQGIDYDTIVKNHYDKINANLNKCINRMKR